MNKILRVLVGCEFSQIVTKAFREKGHEAYSCDLLQTEGRPEWHYQCNIIDILDQNWDLGIFHPPCTHLSVSGARWFKDKQKEQAAALDFVRLLMDAPIPKIAIENPVSIISTRIRKPDFICQPWQFGDPFQKTTCFWLKGLAKLQSTNIVAGREQKCWKEPPSPDRWKNRSRSYRGIAEAMSLQWGGVA